MAALSASTTTDPDGFCNTLLRGATDGLALPLSLIFHRRYQESIVPASWCTTTVIPVNKGKGSKQDPASYRLISFTSVICKVMEGIIKTAIFSQVDQHHPLSEAQHGFRSGRNTQSEHLSYIPEWHEVLDTSYDVEVCYLDFR